MNAKLDQHVCLFDPAIKWGDGTDDATDRDTWGTSRDPAGLVLHEGKRAMVFHCVKLDWARYEWCRGAIEETAVCGRAFRAGVRRVDMPDGSTFLPLGVDEKDFWAMKSDELERFANVVIEEIGALIVQSGKLPFGLRGSYMLRPSSLHVSVANERALRCADVNQARATLRQQKRDLTP